MAAIRAGRDRNRWGMMSSAVDEYLRTLRLELHRRGFFTSRILNEVRCHLLDAVEADEGKGVAHEQAVSGALERFGPARAFAVELATDRSLIMQRIVFALGVLLGYVDSRPTWDDTGITAGMLLIATAIAGALAPQRPWLWALCIGVWIPLFGIRNSANYGSLIALAVAFAGAYAGMLIRRSVIAS
jgi:hypothetical protein